MRRLPSLLLLTTTLVLLAACQRSAPTTSQDAMTVHTPTPFEQAEQQWRQTRHDKLLEPDGWTSLIGLHWLDPGSHYIGSGADNGIRLSMGPAQLGMVDVHDKQLRFVPGKDAVLTLDGQPFAKPALLRSDMAEQGPSVIGFDDGKGEAMVIERGGRYALRVKHAEAPTRTGFTRIDYWPADPAWKIEGRFLPHPPGHTLEIASIIGTTEPAMNPGVVEFNRDGKEYRIEAIDEGEGTLFLVFADRTNGHGSYGAGRFLDIPKPDANGKVMIDFNQSRNPPCAFTAFATCPLPPPENRLDLAIPAGEKAYHASRQA